METVRGSSAGGGHGSRLPLTREKKEISYFLRSCYVLSYSANQRGREKGTAMPTTKKRRSLLKRLVRALPVVLAAAPGVIDAVQQVRRAQRDRGAPPQEPAAPKA